MPPETFFARARARLSLDEPAGLTDPSVIPRHGDHDVDPAVVKAKLLEKRVVRLKVTSPARVPKLARPPFSTTIKALLL